MKNKYFNYFKDVNTTYNIKYNYFYFLKYFIYLTIGNLLFIYF